MSKVYVLCTSDPDEPSFEKKIIGVISDKDLASGFVIPYQQSFEVFELDDTELIAKLKEQNLNVKST